MRVFMEIAVIVSSVLSIFKFLVYDRVLRPQLKLRNHKKWVEEIERENNELDALNAKYTKH